MIADDCRRLREQLEDVAQARERADLVELLDTRLAELRDLHEAARKVTDSLTAIAKRHELAGNLNSTKCIEQVQKVREALLADPRSITKGHSFSNMRKAVERLIRDGATAAEVTWGQYLPRAQPSVDANHLAQAEQLTGYTSIVKRLKARIAHVEKIAKRPPADEAEFQEIETAWEDIRQMISELPEVAADPKVQQFLRAANSLGGAPLDLLTDEVRAWLHENNASEKYRIVPNK